MKNLKIKLYKIAITAVLTICMLTIVSQQIRTGGNLYIYMDSVSNEDTIFVCPGYDSIIFIPPAGASDIMWIYNYQADTLFADTLILQGNYNDIVYCHYDTGGYIMVIISPLMISGTDQYFFCGDSVTLNITTNYTGGEEPSYSWLPTTGLNNPQIQNPIATPSSDITYTCTVTTPDSCQLSDDITLTLQPMNAPNICIVGVDSTNKNKIIWEKPESLAIDSVYIYRETFVTDLYEKIGAVDFNDNSYYTDVSSNPNVLSNKYIISIKDYCGLESPQSEPHKTMHLSINEGQINTWNLIWEPYDGFTVSTYYIYRGTDLNNFQLIGTATASNTQYSDISAPATDLYYVIEIVSSYNCNSSEKAYHTSRSNIASNNNSYIDNDFYKNKLFSIYTNPENNQLIIETKQYDIQNGIIELINIHGQVIYKNRLPENSNRFSVDISGYSKGIYLVKVTGKDFIKTEKIVKY